MVIGKVEVPAGPSEERATNPAVIPFAAKKARPVRAKRTQMTFLTPEEVLTLLKVARERFWTRHCERSKEFRLAESQQKERFQVAAHLEMTTRKSISTSC
jgi:hypothetical protein